MSAPIFYTAELAFPPQAVAPFVQWFAGRHGADLFKAGFRTAACYEIVEGDMSVLDVYQADRWEAFTSDGYRARDKDPYASGILAPAIASANTVYGYVGEVSEACLANIDSDWISVFRFDGEDDAVSRLAAEPWPDSIWGRAGARPRSIRVVSRTKDHPRYPSDRPRHAAVFEWGERPNGDDLVRVHIARAVGCSEDSIGSSLGRRVYPWPDVPAASGTEG